MARDCTINNNDASSCSTANVDYEIQATSATDCSQVSSALSFVPDFTEHPKPRAIKSTPPPIDQPIPLPADGGEQEQDVTFFQDFIAGGVAGSASVIVGHPFDTIKVRIQTAAASNSKGMLASVKEFGGVSSLFRGMTAPLGTAAVINAIVFSSYGMSSRFYDDYIIGDGVDYDVGAYTFNHDPWKKAMACGSFAGLVQCVVICPMEHVKCRLQIQHSTGSANAIYKGPLDATRKIVKQAGIPKIFQGWWSTCLREVPAFGLYFSSYDYLKDGAISYLARQTGVKDGAPNYPQHMHTWMASAFAGGCAGSLTWAIVYPVDIIKTKVQTSPLNAHSSELKMWNILRSIVATSGWKSLFRGLGITLVRAFPVNGTIFPVYEFTLMQINDIGNGN